MVGEENEAPSQYLPVLTWRTATPAPPTPAPLSAAVPQIAPEHPPSQVTPVYDDAVGKVRDTVGEVRSIMKVADVDEVLPAPSVARAPIVYQPSAGKFAAGNEVYQYTGIIVVGISTSVGLLNDVPFQ